MKPERTNAQHVSFVMRLWLERGDSDVPEWRWHILHVQSGQGRAFRSLSDVLDFVEEWARYPPPATGATEPDRGKRPAPR